MRSAFPVTAHSRILLSSGSRVIIDIFSFVVTTFAACFIFRRKKVMSFSEVLNLVRNFSSSSSKMFVEVSRVIILFSASSMMSSANPPFRAAAMKILVSKTILILRFFQYHRMIQCPFFWKAHLPIFLFLPSRVYIRRRDKLREVIRLWFYFLFWLF